MSIHERARGRWMEIWTGLFGIDAKVLDGNHHPCPGCGGVDRFRVNKRPDKAEYGVWFCQGEAKGGVDLCMHVSGLGFKEVVDRIEELVGKGDAPAKPTTRSPAERALQQAQPLTRSGYLRSRGIDKVPRGLYGAADLTYWAGTNRSGSYPAILAPLTRNGRIVGAQATYLHQQRKAPVASPRKTLPGASSTINGAAVQLGDWSPGQRLGFAEGVETAISAGILFDMPVWATLSTSGMRSADWPQGLTHATIFADNDQTFGGIAAAWHLAHRMAVKGVEVEVKLPPVVGQDWNDILMEGKQ